LAMCKTGEKASRFLKKKNTWKNFEKTRRGKKLVLFGVGNIFQYFTTHYGSSLDYDILIDNDKEKTGYTIESIEGWDRKETVVLILSTKYHLEMMQQLEKKGWTNYFVFHLMEYNRLYIKYLWTQKTDEIICRIKGYNKKEWNNKKLFKKYKKEPLQKKIVFLTMGNYSDHGKYIAEEILRRKINCEIVWLVDRESEPVPHQIRKVVRDNFEAVVKEMATAKIWVSDIELPYWVVKRKDQIYIQTKHWSSVTLKKFYLDCDKLQERRKVDVDNWKYNSKIIDHIITGSDFDTETCRKGFRFKGKVWQVGSPRSDILFQMDPNKEYEIREKYNLPDEKRFLLYAPTYRYPKEHDKKHHVINEIDLDFDRLIQGLKKRFGGEWMILLRLHPSLVQMAEHLALGDNVIDVTSVSDGEELVAISEIMITDYSSIMFEPAHVRKTVFLYAPDVEHYLSDEYDLLIDIRELPFELAVTNEELLRMIESFDSQKYETTLNGFMDKYGVCEDGHASERAVDLISDLIMK